MQVKFLLYIQVYVLDFPLKVKPQTPYYPTIEENINNYYPSTCQHKIHPSIYPQQVLESCHPVRVQVFCLFHLK